MQVYSTLGIAYDRLGNAIESQRNYEEALKLDPENALVLNNLAYSLSERDQQLERCLEMAKVAVQKEPNNGAYLDTIGWCTLSSAIMKRHEYGLKKPLAPDAKAQLYWNIWAMSITNLGNAKRQKNSGKEPYR